MTALIRTRMAGAALGLGLAGICAVTPAVATPAPASTPQKIVVTLDRAKLIKLPERVETIVVGSPIIADVTMLKKNGLVVITGKGYGETNVIFVDGAGQAISEAEVTVEHAEDLLTVQRGLDRESYSCAPRCEPAVSLGDASKFLSEAQSQISSRNSLAAPAGR